MTTPAGYPVWSRTSDYATYGGDANKQNYQSQGAINPRTDITAEQFLRLVEDVAECARTAAFCQMSITCNDTVPAAPTVNWVRLGTGIYSTPYSGDTPPTGFPAVAALHSGGAAVTFAASYVDAFGVSSTFAPTHVVTAPVGATCVYVSWEATGSVVTLRSYDENATVTPDAQYTIEVA